MTDTTEKRYHRALTIAASDSGGGAGIQADLKTFAALGCYGMSVLVALTAQNTREVRGIHAVPPDFVELQIDTVAEDLGVDAVKIGMLFTGEVMEAVAERLQAHGIRNVVLDPVMVAKSGAKLIEDEAIEALKSHLLPICTIVTPNLPEAETLLGRSIGSKTEMEDAAQALLELGPRSVLLKGGHFEGEESEDCLVLSKPVENNRGVYWYRSKRIQTSNTHGTGCTLSSAIAAELAKNVPLTEAVSNAKKYISKAIEAGSKYRIGEGHGPLHHFHHVWE